MARENGFNWQFCVVFLSSKKPLNHNLLNVLLSGRSSSLLSSAQIVPRWAQLSKVQKNVSKYACSLSWLPVLLSHCFFVLSHPAQRHIQSNHREQVPALKKWFEGPKVLEGGGHRATTLQENNCRHQQSKMPSHTLRSRQHCRQPLWKYDS